jgi:acyl-CoA thioesterase-1
VVEPVTEADLLQEAHRPIPEPTGSSLEFQGYQDVLQGGEGGEEVEGLEDEAYVSGAKPGTLVLGKSEKVLPVQGDAAGGGFVQAGQEPQEGGLPAPGRAHHCYEGFGSHLQVDGAKDVEGSAAAGVCLMEAFGHDHHMNCLLSWLRGVARKASALTRVRPGCVAALLVLAACSPSADGSGTETVRDPGPSDVSAETSVVDATAGGQDLSAETSSPEPSEAPAPEGAPPGSPLSAPEDPEEGAKGPRVVFLGTSLTAGFGLLREEDGYVARLSALADSAGLPMRAVNAGVSGDTSAGGLRRLEWILREALDVLVVELGANDGLRGQDPHATAENLREIIRVARARYPEVVVLLAAMESPPNLGEAYTERFRAIFPAVAREAGAVLVPFFLEGVAGVPELNQDDGIHPTPEGHRIMARNLWPFLEPALREWWSGR